MYSFARLLTLPLLIGTLNVVAFAEAVTSEQATELLAKSQTIDSKCGFLNSAQHSELSNLVARAEIALATQQSVVAATSALARGKALGKAANCVDSERAEVSRILAAAKSATLQAPVVESETAATPDPRIAQAADPAATTEPDQIAPMETKKRVLSIEVKKPTAKPPKLPLATGLNAYTSLTQRYYLQRRCGTMSAQAINALYQNVVATHQRAVLAFGKTQTAAAMRRAEAIAASQSCS